MDDGKGDGADIVRLKKHFKESGKQNRRSVRTCSLPGGSCGVDISGFERNGDASAIGLSIQPEVD